MIILQQLMLIAFVWLTLVPTLTSSCRWKVPLLATVFDLLFIPALLNNFIVPNLMAVLVMLIAFLRLTLVPKLTIGWSRSSWFRRWSRSSCRWRLQY
jgi:hypothetical protein